MQPHLKTLIAVLLLAAVVLTACGGAPAANTANATDGNDGASAASGDTAEPTATPAPTDTPEPTSTPEPPTATPGPTAVKPILNAEFIGVTEGTNAHDYFVTFAYDITPNGVELSSEGLEVYFEGWVEPQVTGCDAYINPEVDWQAGNPTSLSGEFTFNVTTKEGSDACTFTASDIIVKAQDIAGTWETYQTHLSGEQALSFVEKPILKLTITNIVVTETVAAEGDFFSQPYLITYDYAIEDEGGFIAARTGDDVFAQSLNIMYRLPDGHACRWEVFSTADIIVSADGYEGSVEEGNRIDSQYMYLSGRDVVVIRSSAQEPCAFNFSEGFFTLAFDPYLALTGDTFETDYDFVANDIEMSVP